MGRGYTASNDADAIAKGTYSRGRENIVSNDDAAVRGRVYTASNDADAIAKGTYGRGVEADIEATGHQRADEAFSNDDFD
eukprot:113795-Ditylum_brightwellii.AAC.1